MAKNHRGNTGGKESTVRVVTHRTLSRRALGCLKKQIENYNLECVVTVPSKSLTALNQKLKKLKNAKVLQDSKPA